MLAINESVSEPDPPTWDYVLLENHPTIAQRIAMVQAWRRLYAASDAQSSGASREPLACHHALLSA